MKQALFPHKRKTDEPLSSEAVQKELSRLCDRDALPKTEVATAKLFPSVEKHFRSAIDREMKMPCIRTPYLYMSDEGFLIVFTVLYTLFRASCKEFFAKAEESGEHVFLIFEGTTDISVDGVSDALMLSERTVCTLSSIAKASGFWLDITASGNLLRLSFSFVRFRAVPLSSYSCSEDFILDKMHRAFQLFLCEGGNAFDSDSHK